MGFRVWGSGFGVRGLGFRARVQGEGFRGWDRGAQEAAFAFHDFIFLPDLGLRVKGLGFAVEGLGLRGRSDPQPPANKIGLYRGSEDVLC